MFDFDEVDLESYVFTYNTESHINSAYRHYLEETEQKHTPYKKKKFIFEYVKSEVLQGQRRYGEQEQEWGRLKYYAEELLKQADESIENKDNILKKVYILYDQCIILAHEGFTIPNIK